MTFHSTFRPTTLQKLGNLSQTDVVIGLVTYRTRPAVAVAVAQAAVAGVKNHLPHLKTVILNADAGLKSNLRMAVQGTAVTHIPVVAGRYTGVLGYGNAVTAILHAALSLKARAILILNTDGKSTRPDWVPALSTLVLNQQADLVKPRYLMPLPHGGLNDLLFYPFTRAVWRTGLQVPAAGDFALSPELAQAILKKDVWETEVARRGFDIWLSMQAAVGPWKLWQAALGTSRPAKTESVTSQIAFFKEAIGTMFRQLHLYQAHWKTPVRPRSVPTFTQFAPPPTIQPTPSADCTGYIEGLALGWMEYRPLWTRIMLPENLAAIEYLAGLPIDRFYFPPDLWAKIIYDFAVVYNKGERDPDAIAASLYPLYLGRLASFWAEVDGLTSVGRAGTVAAQAVEFDELQPYLAWRWENYLPWVDSGEKR